MDFTKTIPENEGFNPIPELVDAFNQYLERHSDLSLDYYHPDFLSYRQHVFSLHYEDLEHPSVQLSIFDRKKNGRRHRIKKANFARNVMDYNKDRVAMLCEKGARVSLGLHIEKGVTIDALLDPAVDGANFLPIERIPQKAYDEVHQVSELRAAVSGKLPYDQALGYFVDALRAVNERLNP